MKISKLILSTLISPKLLTRSTMSDLYKNSLLLLSTVIVYSGYLTNRTQTVSVKNYHSRDLNVTSSVPQGLHLGPILFLIFINDITVLFKYVKAKLYADDLKIYANVRFLADAMRIQNDLQILKVWFINNGMEMNSKKCSMISFYKHKFEDFKYFLNTNINDPKSNIN